MKSQCEICGKKIEVEQPVTVSGWYGGRLVKLVNLRAVTLHDFCPEHKTAFIKQQDAEWESAQADACGMTLEQWQIEVRK